MESSKTTTIISIIILIVAIVIIAVVVSKRGKSTPQVDTDSNQTQTGTKPGDDIVPYQPTPGELNALK